MTTDYLKKRLEQTSELSCILNTHQTMDNAQYMSCIMDTLLSTCRQ
jgi:hypothetical protein